MSSYWQQASTQQRLAQIDGAISVGMTMRQTAMNLGTTRQEIYNAARRHGRSFASADVTPSRSAAGKASGDIASIVAARKVRKLEIEIDRAFEIFPSRAKEDHILDKRGDE